MPGKPENRQSARQSDTRKGHQAETVKNIEHVGGPSGVRFPVHDHPDHSNVGNTRSKLGA